MNDPWDAPLLWPGVLAPLPPRLARLAAIADSGVPRTIEHNEDFPKAEELPEVQALAADRWRPLIGAPLDCLLPAAWPPRHRGWVHDRLPKLSMGGSTDEYDSMGLGHGDDTWLEDSVAEEAAKAGLPVPPHGRIWMLRSPWPRIPVSLIYEIVYSLVVPGRYDEIQQMYHCGLEAFTWNEDQALGACSPQRRELVEAWGAAGRVGEAASEFLEFGWTPAEVDDLVTRTGLPEADALFWRRLIWYDHDEAIDFINAWREAGLPEPPPPDVRDFFDRDLIEVRLWLDADFDLQAANRLRYAGVETALRWRSAGFSEAETYETLRRDPDLTPEEAHTFADVIPDYARRLDWIYYGFSPADALAWAAVGLTPAHARIWRALGKSPSDVDGHPEAPPPETLGGSRYFSSQWVESQFDLTDPPGTRGRYARRQRRNDPNPWIHWD